jgi:hypothetical protein
VPVTDAVVGAGVVAAANGEFFIFGSPLSGLQAANGSLLSTLYRFRLTSTGQVTGFSAVPGSSISNRTWIETVAASPDGSEFALALATGSSSQIVVINTATGARSVWQGGMARPSGSFGIASLSWTSNGELVFLAQWCKPPYQPDTICPSVSANIGGVTPSDSQVWMLDPGPAGGRLDSGRMLLGQSGQYPLITQAVINPDGSTLTAAVVNQPASFKRTGKDSELPQDALARPGRFSVDQISVATGAQLSTLYQASFGWDDWWQLSSDGPAGHWLIIGGFGPLEVKSPDADINGWIANGKLTALQPSDGVYSEAWWSAPEPPAATPTPVTSPAPTSVAPSLAVPGPTPPYYVETYSTGTTGQVVVQSTATGAVTSDVGIPPSAGPLAAASSNGTFFVTGSVPGHGPTVYQFHLTSSGQVTGLSALPGGVIGSASDGVDAIAVSPDGSQVAVAVGPVSSDYETTGGSIANLLNDGPEPGKGADDITVINVATGARSVWAGGMSDSLYIPSLSWTANGRELVFLGQTCQAGVPWYWGETGCLGSPTSPAETLGIWALNPAQGGGSLDSGRLLLRQSRQVEDVSQALISGDGSTIIAMVVTAPKYGPTNGQLALSAEQISVSTGQVRRVLYRNVVTTVLGKQAGYQGRRDIIGTGYPVPVLSPGPTGQYWLVDLPCSVRCTKRTAGSWKDGGLLFVLPPGQQQVPVASDAW